MSVIFEDGFEFSDWPNQGHTFPSGPTGASVVWQDVDATVTCIGPGEHNYSRRNPFSANKSKYLLTGSNSVNVIDAASGQITPTGLNSEAMFDLVDPNIVWGIQQGQYYRFDCSTGVLTPITGAFGTSIGDGEGRPSYDGTRVALKNGVSKRVYDISGTVATPLAGVSTACDWFTVSPSGNYLVLGVLNTIGVSGGIEVYSATTGTLVYKFDIPHGLSHSDIGVDCNGRDAVAFVGHGEPFWIDIATGNTYVWDFSQIWVVNGHVSGVASHQRPGYFYFSSVNSTDTSTANSDLFAAQACPTTTPGSFSITQPTSLPWPFPVYKAASNSTEWWGDSGASTRDYADQPHSVPSPDGTCVMTTHNDGSGPKDYIIACNRLNDPGPPNPFLNCLKSLWS